MQEFSPGEKVCPSVQVTWHVSTCAVGLFALFLEPASRRQSSPSTLLAFMRCHEAKVGFIGGCPINPIFSLPSISERCAKNPPVSLLAPCGRSSWTQRGQRSIPCLRAWVGQNSWLREQFMVTDCSTSRDLFNELHAPFQSQWPERTTELAKLRLKLCAGYSLWKSSHREDICVASICAWPDLLPAGRLYRYGIDRKQKEEDEEKQF